jgi:transcriptional regulator with XRE-family HTH domain
LVVEAVTVLVNDARMPNRLAEIRARSGLSYARVAKVAGTSFQQVEKLEKSERRLTIAWMEKLAPAFGIRPSAIMDAEVELLPNPQSGSYTAEDLKRRVLLLALWSAMPLKMQDGILAMMEANAAILRGDQAA